MLPVLAVLLALGLFLGYRRWRVYRYNNSQFSEAWLRALHSGLPIYEALAELEQERLRALIAQFVDQKRFYGCEGLVVTDDMRVIIAAQACLLGVNQPGPLYPQLKSILVYPAAFIARRQEYNDDGTVSQAGHHLSGESWSNGKVVLSWDDVEKGVVDFTDGRNVTLHEFAHQLDSASGSTNGAPILRRNSYQSWARVFSENYEDLQLRSLQGKRTVMDEYGTTNPAEFFAVATETFFEKPHQLYRRRQDLYEEMQAYYQLDPRTWRASDVQ